MRSYHFKLLLSILFSSIIVSLYLLISPFKPFLPYLNYLLGINKPTTYLILLQNDKEMRANGGFAGSYAKVTIDSSVIPAQAGIQKSPSVIPDLIRNLYQLSKNKPNIDVKFQDIYVPNGQLNGHVVPPQPIQDAFQHGTWELANADYEPDFISAATSIRWFFDKGGETNPDILATLNLSTIHDILKIIGPFKVSDYNAEINADNFYIFLQGKAETDFFPGSTQKKDALTSVGNSLKNKLHQLSPVQILKIVGIIYRDLQRSNILVNSQNKDFQKTLEANRFAGQIIPGPYDTFMLTEINLGANKANCCTERLTTHTILKQNNIFHHRVMTTISNLSTGYNPNPPFDYSGHYIAYIRIYIPQTATNVNIVPQSSYPMSNGDYGLPKNVTIKDNFGLKEIGFFLITAAGTQSTIDLAYDISEPSQNHYQLNLLKQHGLTSSPQTIIYNGRTTTTDLLDDFIFRIP